MKTFLFSLFVLSAGCMCTTSDSNQCDSSETPCDPKVKAMSLDDFDNDPAGAYVPCGGATTARESGTTLFARSIRYLPAPELIVEEWVTPPPENMDGKFLLISHWNSWCPPSRRSLKLMDKIQKAYPDDIVVIALSDETSDSIQNFLNTRPDYKIHFAVDTLGRNKKDLEVKGVPHFLLIEPSEHIVLWEGFPLNYFKPLTPELVGKYIKTYKESKK